MMKSNHYENRIVKCAQLIKNADFEALLLTKPSNMFYLTGDGRLCAFAIITKHGEVALGVPQTDVLDVKACAHFDRITGFDDEVGMIHAIADHLKGFGIESGTLGLEYTFLTQAMLKMVTHPHAKPESVQVADATPILSALRMIKEPEELALLRAAAKRADIGMDAAIKAVQPERTKDRAMLGKNNTTPKRTWRGCAPKESAA